MRRAETQRDRNIMPHCGQKATPETQSDARIPQKSHRDEAPVSHQASTISARSATATAPNPSTISLFVCVFLRRARRECCARLTIPKSAKNLLLCARGQCPCGAGNPQKPLGICRSGGGSPQKKSGAQSGFRTLLQKRIRVLALWRRTSPKPIRVRIRVCIRVCVFNQHPLPRGGVS